MALFHAHFFSEVLGRQVAAEVIVPQSTGAGQIGIQTAAARESWPCLWLLHGMSDDHTIWLRRTGIERYAEAAGCAVVMPDGQRSYYADMHRGGAYWTFLSQELPALMRGFFPLSTDPKQQAVAGLSMGGYGAFKWALRCPDQFCGAVSLSGALDVAEMQRASLANPGEARHRERIELIFGDRDIAGSDDDLFALAARAAEAGTCPPLLQICGTEDFLYGQNRNFRAHAEGLGLPLTYREGAGSHEWGFWDVRIREALAWLGGLGFGNLREPEAAALGNRPSDRTGKVRG